MIELERHIEILLLDNDCVIVPGLGGFVAHHVDARFDSRDNMFLPPMRTLGFNAKLNMNDSLLAQSYVEAYDISYPEALSRIDTEVDELKLTLEKDGFYELSDIGVLTINAEGKYEFEPCESGILSPDLYGLAGFEIQRLADETAAEGKAAVVELPVKKAAKPQSGADEAPEVKTSATVLPFGESKLAESMASDDESDERTISIKVSVLRNVIAVACAVVAFFVMATPINTDVYENGKKVSSISCGLLYNLVPRDGSVQPVYILNNVRTGEPAAKQTEAEQKQPEQAELKNAEASVKPAETAVEKTVAHEKAIAPADEQKEKDSYCIVLACRITKANAEAFVGRLHSDGYKDARVIGGNGASLKVVYGSYATEAKALSELNSLKSNKVFEESWIFHVR